jgi:hypothetical protein
MASLREDILDHFADTLTGATPAGTRVYRSHRLLREQDVPPAILIVPVRETLNEGQRGHYSGRALLVRVSVYARGTIADQAADATCIAVHAALMADETCDDNAIRLSPGETEWIFEDADTDAIRVDMHYEAYYTSRRASLTERP